MSEELFNGHLFPGESDASSLETILNRFEAKIGPEEPPPSTTDIPYFLQAAVGVALQELGGRFEGRVLPSECPFYCQIMAGALLVGYTKPDWLERLSQTLCGYTVQEENSIDGSHPLSGRKGRNYQPLSQCWVVTTELTRLIEFMKQKEDVPELPKEKGSESELKDILNRRDAVRQNNLNRQKVFASWEDQNQRVSELLSKQRSGNRLQISGPADKTTNDLARRVHDSTAQLDVGGVEYQQTISWIEENVLSPLTKLVGEKNLSLGLGDKFYLFNDKTAENCPEHPEATFSGVMSLVPPSGHNLLPEK